MGINRNDDIFFKKIKEYNDSGQRFARVVQVSENEVILIYWSGGRWTYDTYEFEAIK